MTSPDCERRGGMVKMCLHATVGMHTQTVQIRGFFQIQLYISLPFHCQETQHFDKIRPISNSSFTQLTIQVVKI